MQIGVGDDKSFKELMLVWYHATVTKSIEKHFEDEEERWAKS